MANERSSADTEQAVIEKFKKWFFDESCHEALNILITGKTGVGKSRLVNALVGRKVAQEGRAKDPCTSEVTCYQADIEGVPITVWDSPGLQDGTTNEARYIQDMKEKIKDVALIIYCVKMDDTRFYEGDKKAIRILTEEFGKEVWKNAIVALTFANKVEDPDGEDELEYFQYQLEEWKRQFTDYLAAVGLNPEVCKSIPVLPVGNKTKSMRLPDRENWLSDLWIECYHVMKASARRGMYRINRHRLKPKSLPASPIPKPTPAPAATADTTTTTTTTTTAATAATITAKEYEDDIPCEIPLNEKQQKSFLESTMDAFVTAVCVVSTAVGGVAGAIASGVVSFSWKILKKLFF